MADDDIDIGIRVGTTDQDIKNAKAAADAVDHFTATVEQSREAMARSGGNFEKFKQILLEIVTAQKTATSAATQLTQVQQASTTTTQQQTAAAVGLANAWAKAAQAQATAGAAVVQQAGVARALGAAWGQVAQAGQVAAQGATLIVPPVNNAVAAISKIPAGARTAANALSIMSSNVIAGRGSLSSFANSAGAAAFGLSQISGNATLVAGAAGFGAIVTVVGVLIGLYEVLGNRQEKVNRGLGDLAKNLSGAGVEALRGRLEATNVTIDQLQKRLDNLNKSPLTAGARDITRLEDRLKDLGEQRLKLQEAIAERTDASEKEVTDVTLKANEAALQSYIKRTQGETAARRQQIAFDEQAAIGSIRISGDREEKKNAAIDAIRKKAAADLAKIDDDESDRITKARVDNEIRVAKITSDTQVAASKEADDKAEASNAEQRARRLISEREFIKTREILELEGIGREEFARLQSIDTQIAAQRKLLDATKEPEKRTQITGVITGLQDQSAAVIANANQQRAKISAGAVKDTADLTRKLGEAVTEASAEALQAQGRVVDAAAKRIHQKFDDLINEALAAKDAVQVAALTAARNLELETARRQQFEQNVGRAAQASDNQIARVNSLLSVHAITTAHAREQIVAALRDEEAAVERSLAGLEALDAATPGNQQTIAQIDAYKTKIQELRAEIAKTADPLFELKQTARRATTDALAGFFEGLSRLGTQDRSQIRALTGDIKGAQDELTQLLAIPASQRSGEVNTRITELRGQIAATSAQLDQAKQSITTWRDLFVSALQSIGDALVKVSSQMLATALIEKVLGIGVSAAIAPTGQPLSGDTLGAGSGRAFGASGGTVFGPEGIDRVPAMLTAGERVITKSRSQQFAPLLDYINFDPNPEPIPVPATVRRYNAGGYVTPQTPQMLGGPAGARDRLHVTVDSGMIGTLIKDYMSSNDGRDITLAHVRHNRRQLGL